MGWNGRCVLDFCVAAAHAFSFMSFTDPVSGAEIRWSHGAVLKLLFFIIKIANFTPASQYGHKYQYFQLGLMDCYLASIRFDCH